MIAANDERPNGDFSSAAALNDGAICHEVPCQNKELEMPRGR
jgi:hypothetical protein